MTLLHSHLKTLLALIHASRTKLLLLALVALVYSYPRLSAETPTKALVVETENNAPVLKPRYHKITHQGIVFHLVCFDNRKHALKLADQTAGPGSRWKDAKAAASSQKGLAAINGGFFTPEGKPLGLAITAHQRRGYINRSSLGAGVYFHCSGSGYSGITRRTQLQGTLKSLKPSELLQAGPMLSFHSKPVPGLSNREKRPRSFIAYNGSHYWLIGLAQDCSLKQLSEAIAGKTLAGVNVFNALNLDGGRSSDLWVSPSVAAGNKHIRGFFNKPVRNFLILTQS